MVVIMLFSGGSSARSSASSFFYNLNPVRWGRTSANSATGIGASSSAANSLQSLSSSSSQAASLSRETLALPNLKKNVGSKENRFVFLRLPCFRILPRNFLRYEIYVEVSPKNLDNFKCVRLILISVLYKSNLSKAIAIL